MVRLFRGRGSGLLDMLPHRIDQVHLISAGREPASVYAGASAGIDDRGWSRRQVAKKQFLRARMLQLEAPGAQAGSLISIAVVTINSVD
jgi:predicted dehydrogenase